MLLNRSHPRLSAALAAFAVLFAVMTGCAGCGSDKAKSSEPSDCTKVSGTSFTLVARNLAWQPTCIQVKAGTTVQFTVKLEDQEVQHDLVISGAGGTHQTKLEAGPTTEHLTYTFPSAGTYGFKCSIHPNMTGTIYAVA